MTAIFDDKENMFAYMVNEEAIGFALKLQVRHPLYRNFMAVELDIEFKYSYGKNVPTFRFSFDIHGPNFVSLFKEGAVTVARSVKAFYGTVGDIIALGEFDELANNPVKWSIDAVKRTKKIIVDTV